MNLTKSELEKSAKKYAQKLIAEAIRNEPEITKDLQEIASRVSAEVAELENKFKTEDSLTQKLFFQAIKLFEYLLNKDSSEKIYIEEVFSQLIEKQNDTLRYTFNFPFEKYVFGIKQSLQELKRQNYSIPEINIWNAWKNIGTSFDNGYRGVNVTVISSQAQKFEIQFHTLESFELKTETHKLYKERAFSETSRERRKEISKITVEMAKKISIPQGVKKI